MVCILEDFRDQQSPCLCLFFERLQSWHATLCLPACQVANQPATECIPLVMEPESRFYTSPVIVLDFQSLYPSMIIAYNLCYSTIVGRPAHAAAAGQPVKLGAWSYKLPPGSLTGACSPDK